MSVSGAPAPEAATGGPADREVGLWRERWFRVLTIVNVSIVIVSACIWVASLGGPFSMLASWLFIFFPVIPATVGMPLVSAVIVAAAAALSALNTFGEGQKGVRFLRAMTVWGTIALVAPVILFMAWVLIVAVGGL